MLQGSFYLPAENADFIPEVETGQRAMWRQGDQWSGNLTSATRDSRAPKHPGNALATARGFFLIFF